MKVSELRRKLEKAGWYLYRSGSNHDIYRHKDSDKQIPLERHQTKEVAKGTERAILKLAGLL
ncbi:Predicted RNA binding protein YcfA, dsRBD-like fold, HicA-like mRNA interferase family [Capnocytophaga haemolytica]|jgi:hypothetical protein|uniref:YcfA-like protein n=1 Tax=Capnocytophaga haemolytica TaxID=45243 RepID=A0AAX2GYB2_9FLAO|nr:type II toxin-antitoxin system HicA family toxin [Capnocytophaga haemolytica]AMD85108.1 hypothetical protein AXF12_05995 [Capnocytophaga haemolytica]SFN67959.1 Predicted RNA binding protein YcfA, dsRBD-like fold, HicA-like mRNA interferase family [Capnocytophaga haemolytica]SNV04965.1 YcfA-like protein [Capnocytophaga haemolytica]